MSEYGLGFWCWGTSQGGKRFILGDAKVARKETAMSEEPPIMKTTDEVRQGVRVKGMTTVLTVSIILAVIAVAIIAMVVSRGANIAN
jgi:hypothetical protein